MSGFGLRAFKAQKQDQTIATRQIYIKNLVVGNDFLAIKKFFKLQNQEGRENVLFLSERLMTRDILLDQWKCLPRSMRNAEAMNAIIGKFPRLEIIPQNNPCVFYKDSKFHEFGGRAKPFELKPGEEYFSQPSANYRLDLMFSDEEWTMLDDLMREGSLVKIIEKIEATKPTDLVEVTNFIVRTGEGDIISCENLYFFDSPRKFLKNLVNKNELSEEIISFATSVQEKSGLVIHFTFPKMIHEKAETVFLPQSVTHEWGHFICDFEDFNTFSNTQEATCLMIIQEDDAGTEEELAKKVKLMKRVMERVYPEMSKLSYKEHILYGDDMFLTDFIAGESTHPHLFLVGRGGMLSNGPQGELSALERGLLTF